MLPVSLKYWRDISVAAGINTRSGKRFTIRMELNTVLPFATRETYWMAIKTTKPKILLTQLSSSIFHSFHPYTRLLPFTAMEFTR